jgi:hypothetical protein
MYDVTEEIRHFSIIRIPREQSDSLSGTTALINKTDVIWYKSHTDYYLVAEASRFHPTPIGRPVTENIDDVTRVIICVCVLLLC